MIVVSNVTARPARAPSRDELIHARAAWFPILLAAVLAVIAFVATPFQRANPPRHAARKHTPSIQVWGARPETSRQYAPLEGRERLAFNLFGGLLVGLTLVAGWDFVAFFFLGGGV